MKTLTVTAMLAVAAAALTGCGNVSFGKHEETRSYTAPAGITALKMKGDGSRVEVVAANTSEIKVSERLSWTNKNNKPKAERVTKGDTLTLSAKCTRATIGFTACGISYRVLVPRDMPVEINNQDGSIIASGLGGTVKLHSNHGSIKVTDMRATSATLSSNDGSIRVSGRATTAELHSDHGSIIARDLTSERLKAHTNDGRVQLSGSVKTADLRTDHGSVKATGLKAERVTAKTHDGSVRLGFTSPPTNVEAASDNGLVRVELPPGEGYAITASTDNGRERIDPALHQDSASSRHIKATSYDGNVTVTATTAD